MDEFLEVFERDASQELDAVSELKFFSKVCGVLFRS